MARLVASERVLRGMTPQARRQLEAALAGAEQAGLAEIRVIAGKAADGHVSHYAGTEWDIQGYTADGKLWSREQRVAVASAAREAGANRFGLYSTGRTLHMGHGPPGSSAINTTWGAGGLTGGEASRRFTNPAELAFSRSVASGQPFDVASLGIAPAAAAGPTPDLVRLAQEYLNENGINVPVSGQIDEATAAGVKAFRSTVPGMAFAERFGLQRPSEAPQMGFAPERQQTPAQGAISDLVQRTPAGWQPQSDPAPRIPYRRDPSQPMPQNPLTLLAQAGAPGVVKGGEVVSTNTEMPPRYTPEPPAEVQPWDVLQGGHATPPGAQAPLRPPPTMLKPVDHELSMGGPGGAMAAEMPPDEVFQLDPVNFALDTTAPYPKPGMGAGTQPPMIGVWQQPPPPAIPAPYGVDYLRQQPVRTIEDMLAGIPQSANTVSPRLPVVPGGAPAGPVPAPRPNPMPMAQRGRSGRTPDGYQWQHIPQRNGPPLLQVRSPRGRQWTEVLPSAPLTEFHSNFNPVRRG